jgi:hypothetical protein
MNTETGAAALRVAYLDATAVRQNHRSTDRQFQPVALHVGSFGGVLADKRLENLLTRLDRHARPVVLDRHHQLRVVAHFGDNMDRAIRG